MENSKAYTYLIDTINASGSKRFGGYYSKTLEDIHEWERDEVEDLIWKTFHQDKDINLAQFLPKLKRYDGMSALKEMLEGSIISSYSSVVISQVLYEYTGDDNYLDIIKQNIDNDENEISYVAILANCKPCKKSYNFLVDIYLNSNNTTNRSTAVTGILYNKGFISNPSNLQEMMTKVELVRKFMAEDVNERKGIIRRLETGQFDKYKE